MYPPGPGYGQPPMMQPMGPPPPGMGMGPPAMQPPGMIQAGPGTGGSGMSGSDRSSGMAAPPPPPMAPAGRGGRVNLPFMTAPPLPYPECPPGLQYLSMLDHLFVRQCLEPVEILTGIETQNAYQVFANGFMIYWAQEHSDFCGRQCCGPNRPFTMSVTDGMGCQVMRMIRPYRCTCCLCCCCLQVMYVEAPMGRAVGSVEQDCTPCGAEFTCRDARGAPILRIHGPSSCCRCGEVEFRVYNTSGQECGKVTKHWGGVLQEAMTDADQFGISFPATLPVEGKAVILGACFLIDFMYFETAANEDHH